MLTKDLAVLFERDLTRLAQEIDAFPDDATLWAAAPSVANPAGTLALHLEGNLREYIGRHLGQIAYTRDRAREFNARGVAREELLRNVEALRETIPPVIAGLPGEALAATYPEPYNGVEISTGRFLFHLLAHFNYHLGQIDYLRRFTTGAGAIPLATF
jgi:hypothetical protein